MNPHPYSAKQVGDEFARQYYQTLQNSPENIYLLYKDNSKISRPGLDGTMRVFTLSDVDENDLKMQSSGGFDSVEVTSVTSQDSHEKGIVVAVYGYFTFNERPARNFTQSFFLAPQEKGYFVLTDMFKFVDIPEANDVIEEKVPETEEAALRVSENVPKLSYASVVMKEIRIGQGQHFSSCDYSPEIKPINGNSRESQMVSEGAAICVKNLPLNATIALVKNALKQFGEIRRGGVKVRSTKYYEGKYAYVEFEEADAANRAIMASPLSIDGYRIYLEKKQPYYKNIKADAGDDTGNGNSQESQGKKFEEAAGICVQNLPPNATIALVERVFKQFGQIKKGRIQVRNPAKSNYWYAFVEFEEADAAERAIKASPLNIDGYTTDVEKKLPYYKKSGRYCESPFAGPGNIHRGEGVRGSLGNPFCNRQKMMEEVRGIDVRQKLMMGSRGAEVYDLHKWQKIMDQSEEQMKFQEEEGRQHNQNRYRSEEVRGTEGVVGLEEEENQNWEKLTEEQRKIQEEEGRQYNQNRYTREKTKETGGVGEEVRGTEAHEANNASKLQEEAGQTEVVHSWDYEQIMEEHRKFLEEQEEESKLNLTSYVEDIEAFYLGVL
ncbi:putative G3BP-like protein isoform X1 [Arabidopsis lyrata subsp. lyrata]|uniref:putative G3BP-like protein isoform X1 n=1 Tax=Arabidopsis lyrata subsp. lyrata TaxID=81972 RepID=UPI000A29CD37|nr:putative G3BP-like protein isoform X1 [Arabidopsis lyrata subsp. lyrata]|eukprot:XP_020886145.1 putative G3BP-like protein isoform X1 [Arabidopsis lyrata subsp. lyrata]